jgi:hypothetical protein
VATDLVLAGIVRKRAEVPSEIKALRTRVTNLQADLAHLDATIRIMDPAADPESIRPKVSRNAYDWFGRGELFRLTMESLREAPEPLTAMEIARTVVARKGLEDAGPFVLRRVKSMIDATQGDGRGLRSASCVGGGM